MAYRFALALLIVAATASCSSTRGASSDARNKPATTASASGGSTAQMDPKRKIAEQDCSKPVDIYQGNLRCK